ncbi:DegT/DnrJ/EryC1/StrS aminotransferase family protein [Polynucleobacter paneuropaeus]|nr:DegT/DnrJ/EryC1/StrS aminotransferase family protein [Polynucleobacter paneuropaeus]
MDAPTSFLNWPNFTIEEGDVVRNVLLSNKVNYWTGQECRNFEVEFAQWVGSRYAVALTNGTLALDLALKALDIKAGDEVIVTPRTFIASISCVVNIGAIPIFADVDRVSGNITAETISQVISAKTKAIICVHLSGWPCDMDPIMKLAVRRNIKVIEDCAQAHGARYKGRSVGTIGHVGAWSFCQDKIMTTGGEGGMVTTNDEKLWRDMWAYKDHGKSYAAVYEREHPPGFKWLHDSFGTNWRMLEMQAAIGRIQLKKMTDWTRIRTKHALSIGRCASAFDALRVPRFKCDNDSCAKLCLTASNCLHAYYKYYVYVKPEKLNLGWCRDRIIDEINLRGVPCYQGSCSEVYREKAFDGTGWRPLKSLTVARELGETSIMFLVHPTLTEDQITKICQVIEDVMILASK